MILIFGLLRYGVRARVVYITAKCKKIACVGVGVGAPPLSLRLRTGAGASSVEYQLRKPKTQPGVRALSRRRKQDTNACTNGKCFVQLLRAALQNAYCRY